MSGVTGEPSVFKRWRLLITAGNSAQKGVPPMERKRMGQTYPYTSFYWKDFHCDDKVMAMTYEQRGIYIKLLWMAWEQNPVGTLPCEAGDPALVTWLGISQKRWAKHKDAVMAAFTFEPDGRWHQKRMKEEYAKAKARSETATKNIKKRWEKPRVGNTDVLLSGNTRASDLFCSDSVSSPEKEEGKLYNGHDPNGPPIIHGIARYVDPEKLPFPEYRCMTAEVKRGLRALFANWAEKGHFVTAREFKTQMADLQRDFRTEKQVLDAIAITLRRGRFHIRMPSETGEGL